MIEIDMTKSTSVNSEYGQERVKEQVLEELRGRA
jgi:hypothetical protein